MEREVGLRKRQYQLVGYISLTLFISFGVFGAIFVVILVGRMKQLPRILNNNTRNTNELIARYSSTVVHSTLNYTCMCTRNTPPETPLS